MKIIPQPPSYMNITFNKFDGQGLRTYTLALKPKPWTVAHGAWLVEESDPLGKPTNNSKYIKELVPLSSYRIYGGVIKGLEKTSSVAIVNRDTGLNGLIQLSPTESYIIQKRQKQSQNDQEQPTIEKIHYNSVDQANETFSFLPQMKIDFRNSNLANNNNNIEIENENETIYDYDLLDDEDLELYDDDYDTADRNFDESNPYSLNFQYHKSKSSGPKKIKNGRRRFKKKSRKKKIKRRGKTKKNRTKREVIKNDKDDFLNSMDSSFMDYEFIRIQSDGSIHSTSANNHNHNLMGDDEIDLSDIRDDGDDDDDDDNDLKSSLDQDFNNNNYVDYIDNYQGWSSKTHGKNAYSHFYDEELGHVAGARYNGRPRILNIEICLIADESVVRFHGSKFLDYVHTLMNIVDEAYHHRSLGVKINIVLSKIIKYRVSDRRYHAIIRNDEHRSLKNVLTYIKGLRQYNHFDLGIFLTKTPFGPAAGYAPVDSVCKPGKAGVLIADRGMNCAFVIAHEIGHTLGMQHDRHDNACRDSPDQGSIMAPVVKSRISRYQWSRCSRAELYNRIKYHTCIHDMPRNQDLQVKFEQQHRAITIDGKRYDGERWSRDAQCASLYGKEWGTCKNLKARNDVECKSLWCENNHKPRSYCMGFVGSPLHGTKCGNHDEQWCFNGFCIYKSSRDIAPQAVDGNWQAWSEWDGCSRTCGVGVQYRHRICSLPKHGGRNLCRGEQYASQLCNTKECLSRTGKRTFIDFREEQCSSLSNRATYKGQHVKWSAGYLPNIEACQLVCAANSNSPNNRDSLNLVNIRMSQPVKDGTRCSYDDPHGICTGGRCVQYGCDYSTNTNMKFDKCGRCNGNNENCIHVKKPDIDITRKILTSNNPRKLHKVVQLAPGSRNIKIIYENWRGTRLNLRTNGGGFNDENSNDASKAKVFLRPELRRKKFRNNDIKTFYKVSASALWYYRADRKRIIITAVGPISRQVNAYIRPKIRRSKEQRDAYSRKRGKRDTYTSTKSKIEIERNDKVERFSRSTNFGSSISTTNKRTFHYEWWYDPSQTPRTTPKNFMWYKHHGPCDVTCGQGYEIPVLFCIDKQSKRKIPFKYCTSLPKPHRVPRPCHVGKRCETPPKWVTTGWSQCSKSCGYSGIRERRVYCQQQNEMNYLQNVAESICNDKAVTKKPATRERCNYKKCEWRTGQWSPCSKTCGPGTRSRLVKCIAPNNSCSVRQPDNVENCDLGDCLDGNNNDNNNNQKQEICTVDGSFFCHGNTDYCYVKGYRDLCCKTCAGYNPVTQNFD